MFTLDDSRFTRTEEEGAKKPQYDSDSSYCLVSILSAEIAEGDAEKLSAKATELEKHLEYWTHKVSKLEIKQKIHDKVAPVYITIATIIGVVSGAAIAVQYLLEHHGPTVTIGGTLGACLIYLLAGGLFGFMFCLMAICNRSSIEKGLKSRIKLAREKRDFMAAETKALHKQANGLKDYSKYERGLQDASSFFESF